LSLQEQFTLEDAKMKAKNIDLFPTCLPDNATDQLANRIYHHIPLIDPTKVHQGQQYCPARKNTEAWE
jgi:hypothetical protein